MPWDGLTSSKHSEHGRQEYLLPSMLVPRSTPAFSLGEATWSGR